MNLQLDNIKHIETSGDCNMLKIKRKLIPLFFILLLTGIMSCSYNANMKLNSDGSAHLEILAMSQFYHDSTQNLYPTEVITYVYQKDTYITAFNYNVLVIDSIDELFYVFNNGYLNFKYYPDSLLELTSNNMVEPFPDTITTACCDLGLNLSFDRKIVDVKSTGKYLVKWKKRKNNLIIGIGNSYMRKHKPINIKIYLDDE